MTRPLTQLNSKIVMQSIITRLWMSRLTENTLNVIQILLIYSEQSTLKPTDNLLVSHERKSTQ